MRVCECVCVCTNEKKLSIQRWFYLYLDYLCFGFYFKPSSAILNMGCCIFGIISNLTLKKNETKKKKKKRESL